MHNEPEKKQSTELFALVTNQIMVLVFVIWLGWQLSEVLILYLMELLVGFGLWVYVDWYWGWRVHTRLAAQGRRRLLLKFTATAAGLGLGLAGLFYLIPNFWAVLSDYELWLFLLLFELLLLLPVWIWQKRGFLVSQELLPAQTRLLMSNWQTLTTPFICIVAALSYPLGWEPIWATVGAAGAKLGVEYLLFKQQYA